MLIPGEPNTTLTVINFLIHAKDLNNGSGIPASMDTCSTYLSHMYNLVFSKAHWETTLYPRYLEAFKALQDVNTNNWK